MVQTKRGGEVSKSELRRMEIVAPEAIKQLREQIAREIEERNSLIIKTSQSLLTPAEIVERCAAIARGQDEFPLVLDGRNDGSVIHAEDLRKTAREWRREK